MTQADDQTLTPAAKAYAAIRERLVGAQLERCQEDKSHTRVCELKRDGRSERIVWDTRQESTFEVPEDWRATAFASLLDRERKVEAGKIEIGAMPVLVE